MCSSTRKPGESQLQIVKPSRCCSLADRLYILSRGQVEVLRRDGGADVPVARLGEGQFFGEIGVLSRGRRTASVVDDVECLTLDRADFKALLLGSTATHKDVDAILRRRLTQLGAVHGLALKQAMEEQASQLLHTTMIRPRLELLEAPAEGLPVAGASNRSLDELRGQHDPVSLQPTVPARIPLTTEVVPERLVPLRWGALRVLHGTSAGMRFPLEGARVVVGRQPDDGSDDALTMQIADSRISRRHLEISAGPEGMQIRDLGSTNGSWLDGRRLDAQPAPLTPGADVRPGRACVLRYEG